VTLKKAEELNKKDPRKIVMFLYHNWCVECKMMVNASFNHEKVAEYINKNYYPVLFDITTKDSITFNGATFVNEGKEHPFHQLAVTLLNGKMNVPQMVFINELNQLTSVVPGYFLAKTVEPVLHFFKEDAYQTQKWEEYVKTFAGEVK
jgi:thioredoxin-related protein